MFLDSSQPKLGLNSTSGEIKESEISGNVRNGNNKISHNTSHGHGIPTDNISSQDRSDKQTDLKHSNSQKVKVFLLLEIALVADIILFV